MRVDPRDRLSACVEKDRELGFVQEWRGTIIRIPIVNAPEHLAARKQLTVNGVVPVAATAINESGCAYSVETY